VYAREPVTKFAQSFFGRRSCTAGEAVFRLASLTPPGRRERSLRHDRAESLALRAWG